MQLKGRREERQQLLKVLFYLKGRIVIWSERKGEEKWVSVPQAEVRVTDILAFPLPAFRGRRGPSPGSPEGLILLQELHPKATLGSGAARGPPSPNSEYAGVWCQQGLAKAPAQGPSM